MNGFNIAASARFPHIPQSCVEFRFYITEDGKRKRMVSIPSAIVRNQPSFAIIAAEAETSAGPLSEPVTAEPVTVESDRPPAAVSELGQRNECPI